MDLVAGDTTLATGENVVVVGEVAIGEAEGIESLNPLSDDGSGHRLTKDTYEKEN